MTDIDFAVQTLTNIRNGIEQKITHMPNFVTSHEYAILKACDYTITKITSNSLKADGMPPCNMSAMRKAMEQIGYICADECEKGKGSYAIREIHRLANESLSTPPRNCDVGTADEQLERMRGFCLKHLDAVNLIISCSDCRLDSVSVKACPLKWGQEPYTEGKQ